jgi:ubiquinone/menaquinone biosynthesis C-methylase UbiE
MLTLFPRIRANPPAPPLADLPEVRVELAATGDDVLLSETAAEVASSPEIAADEAISDSSSEIHAGESAELAADSCVSERHTETIEPQTSISEPVEDGAAIEMRLAEPEVSIAETNIFDEIEIVHEASIEPAATAVEPHVTLEDVVEATHEANPTQTSEELPAEAATSEAVSEATSEPSSAENSPPEEIARHSEEVKAEEVGAEKVGAEKVETEEVEATEVKAEAAPAHPEIAAADRPQECAPEVANVGETPANPVQESAPEAPESPPAENASTTQSAGEASETATSIEVEHAVPAKPVAPPKIKRPKGKFFELPRTPEPEAMEDAGEAEAYASAAAQTHLDAMDDTFVAHAQLLLKGRERGRALDIGTGPGQIVMKLGYHLTRWKFVGVDRSAAMIEKAREDLTTAPELAGRVEFRIADGNSLDFPDAAFDLVFCNSVLHHLAEPQNLFSEMARVVKPGGAILLRDLRRPSRFGVGPHVRKHGKHYGGEMRRLYIASVHAAYTEEELQKMIAGSALRDVRVFHHGKTHIGFERALGNPA